MGIFRKFSGGDREAGNTIDFSKAGVAKSVEAERDESTLESVTSAVMVADETNTIVKVNPSALAMMRAAEADIRKELPNFSAATLLGSNIDIFHKNPAHQRDMLAALSTTYKGQITVGARTFKLTANPVFNDSRTRLGTVVEWEDLSEKLSIERGVELKAEQQAVVAMSNARIKSALDCVTSNVMLADTDNVIVYANDAVIAMLRNAEADIRTELGSFSVASVVGSSVDIFHKNPAHQKSMLAALNTTYKTQIVVGGRTFGLIATPVFDDEGARLATVVEWEDRTSELQHEEHLKNTVDKTIVSAIDGDLSSRIDLEGQEGAVEQICRSVNKLLEMLESVIGDVNSSVNALAKGDLTKQIEESYLGSFGVLQTNVNASISKMFEVVTEIGDSASSVSTGSSEISSGNENLSQRTEEQAASLEETSAAMEQITTTVKQNAANAVQANTLARGARESAENGGAVVRSAISAMDAISESSNKINDIIGVIDEIAFQTNLLALNAAVEAARAGDQGRGFAVVADEVRSLAGRSATAAKEIKELIKDSSSKVQEGSNLVNKSGETLDEIVTAVKKVNDIVAEISTASDEQATGLDEVNKSIGVMDEMTQQNAALVEQAAAASESLGVQADNLDQLTSFFDTGNERVTHPRTATVSATARARKESASAPKARSKKPKLKKSNNDEEKDWSEF